MRPGSLELSLEEVRRLWWWFQDGSIMSPRIRQQLRHAWGFCPRHAWEPASCPHCLGGAGMVCRPHLLAGEPSPPDLAGQASQLHELAADLGLLVESMTLHGPAATPEATVAWVRALGWFAGWGLAHALAGSVSPVRS
jgi:hypothetical protein